ncbi:MAG: nucleotidyltransferase domain-containing protein [Candidatus Ranarchaeia archaeon]
MVKEKVAAHSVQNSVVYSSKHWNLLRKLRESAVSIMEALVDLNPSIHGSICRGDIRESSDIDIIFFDVIPEFRIEKSLQDLELDLLERTLIQATPLSAVKAHMKFQMENEVVLTWPLFPFLPREIDFYAFGGILSLLELKADLRVQGVDKRLLLIEPTPDGHREIRVDNNNAGKIARTLKISINTVQERLRVLERRDKLGRTGVFQKRELAPDESFGSVLKQLVERNPATRRRQQKK